MKKRGKITQALAFFLALLIAVSSQTSICFAKAAPKKKYKVAIDAGHQTKGDSRQEAIGPGSKTTKERMTYGATGRWSGMTEAKLNLIVAKRLASELKRRGYDVYMIRTTSNVNLSNQARAKRANKAKADICIHIHANSFDDPSAYGALTMAPYRRNPYMKASVAKRSQKLAKSVLNSFCKATKAKKRSIIFTDGMTSMNWCSMPTTIVEMGFMSNRNEDLKMSKGYYQRRMVQGIADGIDAYFKK